jgi:hypothetical protein
MKTLTYKALVERLNSYAGVTFVSCSLETDAKLKKGGRAGVPVCSYPGTMKQVSLNGAVGFSYENSVNKQRDREDVEEKFEAHQRAWGTLMEGRKFVEHKGNYYLQLKVENSTTPVYLHEGQVVSKEDIDTWLPKKSASSRQGVENQVIIRDVKLSNIKTITFGKETYTLIEDIKL